MADRSGEKKIERLLRESVPELHWGNWVKARSLRVGYRRQKDLAASIGCEYTVLYKWKKMTRPPTRMQKGFDVTLASALKTDREMLFNGWLYKNPEDAPIVESLPANEPSPSRDEEIARLILTLRDCPREDYLRHRDAIKATQERMGRLVDQRMKSADARREKSRSKPPQKK
ncbi:MAG: hypothetical protein ABSB74_10280 [Tepidisphaeraceae bacterium]